MRVLGVPVLVLGAPRVSAQSTARGYPMDWTIGAHGTFVLRSHTHKHAQRHTHKSNTQTLTHRRLSRRCIYKLAVV
jgi:hypothetical protein